MNKEIKTLGETLWKIACELRGSMNASDFQDYMLSFIFLRYLSEQYCNFIKDEIGSDFNTYNTQINNMSDNEEKKAIQEYSNKVEKFINKKITEYINNHEEYKKLTKKEQEEKKEEIKNIPEYEIYREMLYAKKLTVPILLYLNDLEELDSFEEHMRKKYHYVIKPQYLWNNLSNLASKEDKKLLPLLSKCFKYIEDESFNDSFHGLFSEVNLTSDRLGKTQDDRNDKVCSIIKILEEKLSAYSIDTDVLGDAYEILISKFASNSGAKAGEFYTPQQVSNILSEIVIFNNQEPTSHKKETINNLLDFTCGSGSLLINVIKHMKGKQINHIYGQEKNITTYNLARMNMLLHNVKENEFKIFHGDTLKNEWDEFNDINPAKKIKCDAVVANPPFSLQWEHQTKYLEDFRFKDYGLAPQSTADFAFLLHGFHYLSQDGTMAIVLPHGILFRGGAEYNIRRKLIEDGNIDAIIGLPANLFYSTGIPVCIVVLKKCKSNNNILFINANKEYVKGRGQNELSNENVKKIVDIYRERKNIDNFSRTVELDEIKNNDYNLNVSRYVSTAEEDKVINLKSVNDELINIENKIKEAREEHNKYLKELGLEVLP